MTQAKKLNTNLVKLVARLNDGQYHDGTTLGAALRMTRSAIWKAIKKLENYGVKLDCVKGKGYALLEPLMLLDQGKIKKLVEYDKLQLLIFESLGSTNQYLATFKPTNKAVMCLTEQQTQGRGRLGREWYGPFAKNIYLSCRYPFQKDISELAGLSLVTSLAVINTLRAYGINDELFAKWPNDIVYAQQKLSGNLIDIQAESHGNSQAVIGIGINVNMLDDERQISQTWTSLQKVLGEYVDRNLLCARLINSLLDYLQRFAKQGFKPFVEEWLQTDCLIDRHIAVKNLSEMVSGKVTGVNDQGHLVLRLADGKTRAFSSGDTSIVKK